MLQLNWVFLLCAFCIQIKIKPVCVKVLSGCEWGNMLLWDGGICKVEISRRNRRKCHQGSIQQVIFDEGEIFTIGIDGYIRVRVLAMLSCSFIHFYHTTIC